MASAAVPFTFTPTCSDEVICSMRFAPLGSVMTTSIMSLKLNWMSSALNSPLKKLQSNPTMLPPRSVTLWLETPPANTFTGSGRLKVAPGGGLKVSRTLAVSSSVSSRSACVMAAALSAFAVPSTRLKSAGGATRIGPLATTATSTVADAVAPTLSTTV